MSSRIAKALFLGTVVLLSTCLLGFYKERSRTEHGGESSSREALDLSIVHTAYESITPTEAQTHVNLLASRQLEGRETGKSGQWLAAKYIGNEFQQYGLQTAGDENSYYQNFHLETRDLAQANLWCQRTGEAVREIHFSLQKDFMPFEFTGENSLSVPMVFAGYGITAPEFKYDDYANIDVRGKVVLVFRHEPQEHDPHSIFSGTKLTKYAYFEEKVRNALAHGAVGLLLLTDPAGNHDTETPPYAWPSVPSRRRPPRWKLQVDEHLSDFPAAWISLDCATVLLSKTRDAVTELQKKIDESLLPLSFEIPDTKVYFGVELRKQIRRTQNVIGLLPGNDPQLRHEVVVLGAHYDHIGIIDGRIHSGADDNASGTAGLLEIAEAFTQIARRPKRSVLFMAFTAEELGLLGSKYYVENPVFPLEKTVAMINLDMIGRNHANAVSVIGSNRSPEIHKINLMANREIGLELRYDGEHFFNRSDHANFAKYKIPVIFYNTGVHQDYHAPGDLPHKIDAVKVSRIAKLAFLVAWELANSDQRPTYSLHGSR